MQKPFGKLMEMAAAIHDHDNSLTIGDLSREWGEPPGRVMDALEAVRIFQGGIPYIDLKE